MAKKAEKVGNAEKITGRAAAEVTPAAPSTAVPAPRASTASRTTSSRVGATAAGPAPTRGGSVADDVTSALLVPVHVVQQVMPTHRAPVYLGAAALALFGVVEWPVALGAGLAWEALRRWGPER